MVRAVESCVHCGFCLPTCPTYKVLGEEMDSPRGRIVLMKEALEGHLSAADVLPYVDRCLGCLACETSCPSGVRYGELLMPFRALAEGQRVRRWTERLQRRLLLSVLPYPARFRLALRLGTAVRPLRRLLPARLRAALALLPARVPPRAPLGALHPARGSRRARVALLAGCAQAVLAPGINAATVRVLVRNGVEVVVPSRQACCGALSLHAGDESRALSLARSNLAAFPSDVDAVLANAAGCGSGMMEYPLLFRGLPEEERARAFAARVQDASVFLDALGIEAPPPLPRPLRLAYHDACHLAHAQGVRAAPRRLLAKVANLEVLEPRAWEICCGSAGTYNLEHPDIAAELGRRKAQDLLDTGAEAIAAGNIGCLVQIERHMRSLGASMPVVHTLEILDWAYGGGQEGGLRPT
jgi:glycolate oxidase iron-sulfur subunit